MLDDGTRAELVIELEGWIRRVPLEDKPLVMGRSSDCDVLLGDPKLSRRHCRLIPQEGRWLVEDLGSQAGTVLDGVPVHEPTLFEPGARLRIGSIQAFLELRSGRFVLSGSLGRDERSIELLLRTVGELYGTRQLDEVLRTVVDRTILLAGADRGALLLASPDGALEAAVARDASGNNLAADQVLIRALPGKTLESGRAMVLTDTAAPGQREQATPSVLLGELRSVVCVPLPGTEGPIGVLYADGRRPAEAFGPAELAILEALAVHGALAIERARFREEQDRRQRAARRRLETENAALKARLEVPIGESVPMRRGLDLIRRIAPSDATVCFTGETGTGKEVLARYLHQLSSRGGGPFVVVDCGAIPEGLIESELFGHEKGAFTGAAASRVGRFREAQGGTVFLDEIGELPLALQTRLLRVLQEHTIQPVGGTGRIPVDVRIVCATHRDLQRRVAEGQFRQDLFYRISVLTVSIPPLRERGPDILSLAQHFLGRFADLYGTALTGFTRDAKAALLAYSWPGNVRELENRVQRAAILARPPYTSLDELGLGAEGAEGAEEPAVGALPFSTLQQARAEANERFERVYLEEALRRAKGKMQDAATLAGVSRQLFQRLLRRHGIDRRLFKKEASPDDQSLL